MDREKSKKRRVFVAGGGGTAVVYTSVFRADEPVQELLESAFSPPERAGAR